MKQPSYLCSCVTCHKPFSSLGIDTHAMRSHGTTEQQNLFKNAAIAKKAKAEKLKSAYYTMPNYCKECNSVVPYSKKIAVFVLVVVVLPQLIEIDQIPDGQCPQILGTKFETSFL